MILILSNNYDISTYDVIDWLNSDFIRIDSSNFLKFFTSSFSNKGFSTLGFITGKFNTSEIKSFWYRRDNFVFGIMHSKIECCNESLDTEFIKLNLFLHFFFESSISLGSYKNEHSHNKLIALYIADKIGLYIPPTLITTDKINLKSFQREFSTCITKAIGNMFKVQKENFTQLVGTHEIKEEMFDYMGDNFIPTLIQKKIDKAYELRIFYMKNQFYAMAIFSQNDEKTKLDYRNYNREKPNRNIPYILPKDIEEKLQKLMDKLDLDTGSIDMIVTPEGDYVFLEVNPTGQFGWVSENCNYYLEEHIANYLQGEA